MPTFDAASSAGGTGINTLSWSHTCSASADRGIGICGGLRRAGSEVLSSVSYNSVAATALSSDANGLSFTGAWWLVAPASGTHTAQINLSGTATALTGMAVSVTDCAQANPTNPDEIHTGNGNSTTPTVAAINTNSDMMVISVVSRLNTGGTYTPGGGQTERIDTFDPGGWTNSAMGTVAASAGSTTPSWTITSSNWSMVAWRILPATPTANTIPVFMHHYRQQGIA